MTIKLTVESFLKDVENHKMVSCIGNEGVRDIKFKKPDSGDMWFGISTFSGHLCIYGDMGCYVFSRYGTDDMFNFFRSTELKINYSSWSEKIVATSRFGKNNNGNSWEYFDFDKTIANIKENYWDSDKVLAALEEVSEDNSDVRVYDQLNEIEGLEDVGEHMVYSPCYHVLWCMYAIVWAIQQYDAREV